MPSGTGIIGFHRVPARPLSTGAIELVTEWGCLDRQQEQVQNRSNPNNETWLSELEEAP
ncbi:MAG: hypothetical protein ABI837_12260 [Acidobacteriota bacterium]